MRGLVGTPLGHSYSPYIHKQIIDKEYELYDLNEEKLISLLKSKNFDCLNVTIPYKQTVMSYLDKISDVAKSIGAVNCIKNKGNILIGHNSDYEGFLWLLSNNKIDLTNMNVAILGTGGSSKAILAAVKTFNCKNIYLVSSSNKQSSITYKQLYELSDIDCVINTTPVGMYPNTDESAIDIKQLTNVKVVIDIIYNPFKTKLLVDSKNQGIKVVGGIEMLVAQAVKAVEFFEDIKVDDDLTNKIVNNIVNLKRNIVLIGMPGSGKSTIGKKLSKQLDMNLLEVDDLITEKISMSIKDYFEKYGESKFREVEKEVIKSLRNNTNSIISCGGGVIKNKENIDYLSRNGIIIFLDRNINKIAISNDRPLTQNKEQLKKLYDERINLYKEYSDIIISNDGSEKNTIENIKREINL